MATVDQAPRVLTAEVAAAILGRFQGLAAESNPFPPAYASQVFPDPFYRTLLTMLPGDEILSATDQRRSSNPYAVNRRKFTITPNSLARLDEERRAFWTSMATFLCGGDFLRAVASVFREGLKQRYGARPLDLVPRLEINVDNENYAIPPHTDAPVKVGTLLFYLPSDESQSDLGTSIYVPRDRGFRSEEPIQYPFEKFETVRTFPFLPNSMFGFIKTDNSFHGRPPVKGEGVRRRIMTLSIQHRPSA